MPPKKRDDGEPIVIKKYANRRLYNTASSAYVTLEDLRELVSQDVDFVVLDAKSGEDLTRAVLTQILAEAEQSGTSLLPVGFLRQVISMYGDGMSWLMPQYLEHMTEWFEGHQQELRRNMEGALGGVFPVGASMDAVQDATRRNMAAFEQAMRAFWPNIQATDGEAEAESGGGGVAASRDEGLEDLRRKLADMQTQLDALSKKSD